MTEMWIDTTFMASESFSHSNGEHRVHIPRIGISAPVVGTQPSAGTQPLGDELGASAPGGRSVQTSTKAKIVALVGVALGTPVLFASTAFASSNKIGSFQMSGEVSGSITIPTESSSTPGYAFYGCVGQSSQSSTPAVLLQLTSAKLQVDGKSTTATGIEITVDVPSTGTTAKLMANGEAKVELVLVSKGKTYLWASISGSAKITSRGTGSLSASLLPAGSASLADNPVESGKATKPAQLNGTWTSCHGKP